MIDHDSCQNIFQNVVDFLRISLSQKIVEMC